MNVPEDRRYTEEHEWALAEDGRVRIGITDYAQEQLGDVVYLSLPRVDRRVQAGEMVAEVESNKSVAEVFAPLNGTVVAVNEALAEAPELVNRDPYGEGWFILLEAEDPAMLDGLLDAAAYRALLE
ncbi:MAG TPA: glycine cleavage system protein GcvH [Acidimicrobiia bacterium]|nr:glycine cleavage system protein GcvH [Acidimicrobiia bacterium]